MRSALQPDITYSSQEQRQLIRKVRKSQHSRDKAFARVLDSLKIDDRAKN